MCGVKDIDCKYGMHRECADRVALSAHVSQLRPPSMLIGAVSSLAYLLDPHLLRSRCLLPGELRVLGSWVFVARRAGSIDELENYFRQHQIQDRLNVLMNELVKARPAAPYAWLKAQLTEAAPASCATSAETVPQLPASVGMTEIGARFASSWGYCQAFSGGTSCASETQTQVAPAAGKSGIILSIEPAGKHSVLLAIRSK
uniref:Uncharacterized protein n=1 Tax=Chrysotila carterae TaxID=13221 RepID=A0A7S4ESJ2_CHRCT